MKYQTLLLSIGPLLAACASDPSPPASSASSASVAAATDNPTASTTPVETHMLRDPEVDRNAENLAPGQIGDAQENTSSNAAEPRTESAPLADTAASPSSPASPPDNTRVNARDRSGDTLTPGDQGGSEADRKLTQKVRQAVMGDSSLSFTAKNVKIITVNGKVTLRGPVKSEQERSAIEASAKRIAGASQVENLLEIMN